MKEYFEIKASKATSQYGFQKGLNIFGNDSYQASKDKIKKNLLRRGCIDMVSTYNVTFDIRKKALGYLVFLKRKPSGKMKGKGYVNRHPRQEYIGKEESKSPTVLLYLLMISCVMGTLDERKVITVDIPGVFLQGDCPQDKHPGYIMFEGIMVDMICKNNSLFDNMIILSKDGKKKFLYG